MRQTLGRITHAARTAYVTLGLTVRGVAALVAGVLALGAAVVVFGAATEDVTRHNGLAHTDPAHLRFFIDHRSGSLDELARVVTTAGMIAVLLVIATVATGLFWYRGLRAAVAVTPIVSLAVASFATATTKALVGRTRPPVSLHLVSETDASFPSGHATSSTAVFLTIALVAALYVFRRPITRVLTVLAAALLAGAVGISRLVLGVHWPSDVLAGWALGMTVALTVTITFSLLARPVPRQPRHDETLLARATLRVHDMLRRQRPRRHTLDAA
jgi:undecaprenyl-diphosphatase